MANQNTNPQRSSGTGAIAFIVGGLVVAVALLWFLFADNDSIIADPVAETNNTSISIDTTTEQPAAEAPAAVEAVPAEETAPEAAPAAADETESN